MSETHSTGWLSPDIPRLRVWFGPSLVIGLAAAALIIRFDGRNEFQIFLALVAAWLAAAATSLFAQARGWRPKRGLATQIVAAALAAAAIWFSKPLGLYPPLFFAGLSLACFAAPGKALADAESSWVWAERTCLAGLLALLGATIGTGTTIATLASADQLLGIGDWARHHYQAVAYALFFCVVGPAVFLAILPPLGRFSLEAGRRDFIRRAAGALAAWALTPFVLIYSALLWIYAAKIAWARSLPDGQIGWMVGAFGCAALATILLIFPQRATGPKSARLLWRIWPVLLVAPLILLGFAIAERLDAYGLTPGRYAAILLALLCAANGLVALTGRERIVRFAPAAAALAFLLTSFGPWGAVDGSIRWQTANMRAILAAHGFMRDGAIFTGGPAVDLDRRESQRWRAAMTFLGQSERLGALVPANAKDPGKLLAALVNLASPDLQTRFLQASAGPDWTATPEFAPYAVVGSIAVTANTTRRMTMGALAVEQSPTELTIGVPGGPAAVFDYSEIATRFSKDGKLPGAPMLRPTRGDARIVLLLDNLSLRVERDGKAAPTWFHAYVLLERPGG